MSLGTTLNSLLSIFVPKDRKFFTLFEESATNLVDIAASLKEMLGTPAGSVRSDLGRKIHELENIGDDATHEIMIELSSNFITPFDREDIHALAYALDNVADYIDAVAKRIELYKIHSITDEMKDLAVLIESAVKEIKVAISEMKDMKNIIRVKEALIRINSIENESDVIYNHAIAKLFDTEKDAIQLIKYREIYENLENATDRCEDVADVIESIIVKNS